MIQNHLYLTVDQLYLIRNNLEHTENSKMHLCFYGVFIIRLSNNGI